MANPRKSAAIDYTQRSIRSRWPFAALVLGFGVACCVAATSPHVDVPLADHGPQRVQIDMKGLAASDDVLQVAQWALRKNVHRGRPFIIADKPRGLLFAFDANGGLLGKSPALFGAMHSDVLTDAQAAKAIDDVLESDKITPAGVFASAGYSSPSYGESIRFAKYAQTNLLIHRAPNQFRLKRLLTQTINDNRITYGCINALPEFVDTVLLPNFSGDSTVIVMPEMQSARSFFAINDVNDPPVQVATMPVDEAYIISDPYYAGKDRPRAEAGRKYPPKSPRQPKDEKRAQPTMITELRVDLRKKIA